MAASHRPAKSSSRVRPRRGSIHPRGTCPFRLRRGTGGRRPCGRTSSIAPARPAPGNGPATAPPPASRCAPCRTSQPHATFPATRPYRPPTTVVADGHQIPQRSWPTSRATPPPPEGGSEHGGQPESPVGPVRLCRHWYRVPTGTPRYSATSAMVSSRSCSAGWVPISRYPGCGTHSSPLRPHVSARSTLATSRHSPCRPRWFFIAPSPLSASCSSPQLLAAEKPIRDEFGHGKRCCRSVRATARCPRSWALATGRRGTGTPWDAAARRVLGGTRYVLGSFFLKTMASSARRERTICPRLRRQDRWARASDIATLSW